MSHFGLTLDEWEELYETFYQKINPDTAPEEWIDLWLYRLFGWSWYPAWYTVKHKRELFRFFAVHLARRGTRFGIEDFLRAFLIYATVWNRPQYWGEFYFGDGGWTVTAPLGLVVQVSHLGDQVNPEAPASSVGEFFWGEGYFAEQRPMLTRREIEDLIRFQWPTGQQVMIDYSRRDNVGGVESWNAFEVMMNEELVPEENSGPIGG
jgi:hypothetical protein